MDIIFCSVMLDNLTAFIL